jgi:hypothetical protein
MTDSELQALVIQARAKASAVGTQHALWDVIFDAEAHLQGATEKWLLPREKIEKQLLEATRNM